jgi:hypothetical protein
MSGLPTSRDLPARPLWPAGVESSQDASDVGFLKNILGIGSCILCKHRDEADSGKRENVRVYLFILLNYNSG